MNYFQLPEEEDEEEEAAQKKMQNSTQKGLSRSPAGGRDGANHSATTVPARCRTHKEKCFVLCVFFRIFARLGLSFCDLLWFCFFFLTSVHSSPLLACTSKRQMVRVYVDTRNQRRACMKALDLTQFCCFGRKRHIKPFQSSDLWVSVPGLGFWRTTAWKRETVCCADAASRSHKWIP